jgi:hypothetical protein
MANQALPMPVSAVWQAVEFTRNISIPICWHDFNESFPKHLVGATCFVLRFENRLVGVTAEHVLQVCLSYLDSKRSTVCQLGTLKFGIHDALIDRDLDSDVATFEVSETQLSQLQKLGKDAIDCRGDNWSPPEPVELQSLTLVGYPQNLVQTAVDRSADRGLFAAAAAIESFSAREIWLTYDPTRDKPLIGSPLPLHENLSGCSGAPALMHGIRNGLHRWFAVGLFVAGPKRDEAPQKIHGEMEEFAILRVQRIHRIQRDGTILRETAA